MKSAPGDADLAPEAACLQYEESSTNKTSRTSRHARESPANSVLASCLAFAAAAATAADWPARPIRFVTPAAPGGTTDGLSRIFSARMTETLRTQVIVDNRGSSSGVLAAEIVRAAAPDGYTLFMAYHQHTVNATLLKLPYHPVNDFTPITQLTEAGIVLVVHPSSPRRTSRSSSSGRAITRARSTTAPRATAAAATSAASSTSSRPASRRRTSRTRARARR